MLAFDESKQLQAETRAKPQLKRVQGVPTPTKTLLPRALPDLRAALPDPRSGLRTIRRQQSSDAEADSKPAGKAVPSYRLKWIEAHLADSSVVAKELDLNPEEILGLSALESGWGRGRFAKEGNNFFGMHAPQPGALPKTIQATGDPRVKMATYASYLASAESFAAAYGSSVKGIKDATRFATVLQTKCKFGIGPNGPVPTYVPDLSATIRGLGAALRP